MAETQPPTEHTEAVLELQAWERRWLPIAKATFAAHRSGGELRFFSKHARLPPRSAIVTAGLLLTWLDGLDEGDSADPELVDRLRRRGLTTAVRSKASELLKQESAALFLATEDDESPEQRAERREQAGAAMWSWYIEWSAIARAAIKDKKTLRLLGFRRAKTRELEGETVEA